MGLEGGGGGLAFGRHGGYLRLLGSVILVELGKGGEVDEPVVVETNRNVNVSSIPGTAPSLLFSAGGSAASPAPSFPSAR